MSVVRLTGCKKNHVFILLLGRLVFRLLSSHPVTRLQRRGLRRFFMLNRRFSARRYRIKSLDFFPSGTINFHNILKR